LYEKRLNCSNITKEVKRSEFREKLLVKFPQAQEQSNGKNKILVFEQGMQQVLKQVMMETNYENEAVTLAKATKIVCKKIIGYKSFHFDGKFPVGCQQ